MLQETLPNNVILPQILQIELTSNCNLKCTMCPLTSKTSSSSITPGNITEYTWEQILPVARAVGQVLVGGFGELFTFRESIELIKELDDNDIVISFSTNGHALTSRICEQIAQLKHLCHVNVSIDSPDPKVYSEIRGGDLEKAIQGLRNLLAAIQNHDMVTVSSIIMNNNIASLVDFPPFLAGLGVKRYVVQCLHNKFNDAEERIPQAQLQEVTVKIEEACARYGISMSYTDPERIRHEINNPVKATEIYYKGTMNPADTRMCTIPWTIPFIDKDGQVFPCCMSTDDSSLVMGNLNKESFISIWEGKNFQMLRQDILHGDTLPDTCRRCTNVPYGKHPYATYNIQLLFNESILENVTKMRLVAKNAGDTTWTQHSFLRIGTSRKRDRHSTYFHPSWLSFNRVCTFNEDEVPPGSIATFDFEITNNSEVDEEYFELVVDGTSWIINTTFTVRPGPLPANVWACSGTVNGTRCVPYETS